MDAFTKQLHWHSEIVRERSLNEMILRRVAECTPIVVSVTRQSLRDYVAEYGVSVHAWSVLE